MLEKFSERSFLSPIVAFTFIPVSVTGLFLLFHVRFPSIKDIHQWLGLAFTIFCAFHVVANWKSLIKYFSSKEARVALILTVILIVLCGFLGFNGGDDGHRSHNSEISYNENLHR